MHTPALYSSFLRALIAAKFDNVPASATSTAETSNQNGEQEMDGAALDNGRLNTNSLMLSGTQYQPMGLENSSGTFFQSAGEMGPAADITIFPPRMVNLREETSNLLSLDSILSSDFWDSVLVPGMVLWIYDEFKISYTFTSGYSQSLEGLSAGFVYGANGNSGYIASRLGSPITSTVHTPLLNSRSELVSGQLAVS